MSLPSSITVSVTCVAKEQKLEGEAISTVTLRFDQPDPSLGLTNLSDFVFKISANTDPFIIGEKYTVTLQ